jgi:hypothetical protein
MTRTKKGFVAAVVLAAAVFVAAAAADRHSGRSHEHGKLLRAQLVGSILSDPPLHGVNRGGLPWKGNGRASLDRRGRFEFRIRNLVIPSLGNPGPVTTIKVALYCAPDASGPAFITDTAPLSRDGDARIRQHVAAPSRCLAPVLLVHPNGNTAAYIAASGFTS